MCVYVCLYTTFGYTLSVFILYTDLPQADVQYGVQRNVACAGKVVFVLSHINSIHPFIHRTHTELWGGGVFPEKEIEFVSISVWFIAKALKTELENCSCIINHLQRCRI